MTEATLKLAAWFSPSFPVGAFAYSHGVEAAVASGAVSDGEELRAWIAALLRYGAGRNDAILLLAAMRGEDVAELDELARAFAASKERLQETVLQGAAFAEAIAAAWGGDGAPRAYPVAVGVAAREHALPEHETTLYFLHAFTSAMISVGIRTIPIGQAEGQRILAALGPVILETIVDAAQADCDSLGGCALLSDIAAMQHETLSTRLFRT